jgi:hypothetical protein
MDAKVIIARDYFDRLFQAYMNWSNNGKNLSPHYIQSTGGLSGFTKWKGSSIRPNTDKPIFTHALMDTLAQNTSEPLRRSCLTGFELFYRHVALWEAEQDGKLHIQADVWSSTTVSSLWKCLRYLIFSSTRMLFVVPHMRNYQSNGPVIKCQITG